MPKKLTLTCAALLLLATSCKENKADKEKDIIVPAPKQEVRKGPKQMAQTRQETKKQWEGTEYNICILRQADKSIPLVKDESGQEYYDNRIKVEIKRADGSVFFSHEYLKTDFESHLNPSDRIPTIALLGIVFDKIENNRLVFAASIGSPDVLSDEYIPFTLTISSEGTVTIKQDTKVDIDNPNVTGEGGITGNEEA